MDHRDTESEGWSPFLEAMRPEERAYFVASQIAARIRGNPTTYDEIDIQASNYGFGVCQYDVDGITIVPAKQQRQVGYSGWFGSHASQYNGPSRKPTSLVTLLFDPQDPSSPIELHAGNESELAEDAIKYVMDRTSRDYVIGEEDIPPSPPVDEAALEAELERAFHPLYGWCP